MLILCLMEKVQMRRQFMKKQNNNYNKNRINNKKQNKYRFNRSERTCTIEVLKKQNNKIDMK